MSSILRALKKLENEPRHLEKTQTMGSKFIPLADTSPQKSSAGILMMVIGGGFVCGLVFFAGWWLFSKNDQPPPVAPYEISRQSQQQPEMIPGTPADQIPKTTPAEIPQPSPPAIAQREVMSTGKQAADSAIQVPETPRAEINEQIPAEKNSCCHHQSLSSLYKYQEERNSRAQ